MTFYRRLLLTLAYWLSLGMAYVVLAFLSGTFYRPETGKLAGIWLITGALLFVGGWLARRDERLGRGFMSAAGLAYLYACFFYLLK